jgi:calmodulin
MSDKVDEIKAIFDVFDRDSNGYISASELKLAMANLDMQLSDDEVKQMIKAADLNNDQQIDFQVILMFFIILMSFNSKLTKNGLLKIFRFY